MGIGHDGCLACPAQACSAGYRGSQCRFLCSQAGVDADSLTWAEKLRTMSAEDMAEFICSFAGKSWFCEYSCQLREKCKTEAPTTENAMVALHRTPVAQNKTPFPAGHLSALASSRWRKARRTRQRNVRTARICARAVVPFYTCPSSPFLRPKP